MSASLGKWQSVLQQAPVVQFFDGLFERVGVRVTGTGEAFTCVHQGTRIAFEPTLDESKVDYTVEIDPAQVERLANQASKGAFDQAEQYRIMAELFTPATAAILKHPQFSGSLAKLLTGAEEVIHVRLASPPPGEPEVAHTLYHRGEGWEVEPGLHGTATRHYTLPLEEALAFQRRAFALIRADSVVALMEFALWYRSWRKGVSSAA
jgi:hypothetical protein